jgi:hypothetical protein
MICLPELAERCVSLLIGSCLLPDRLTAMALRQFSLFAKELISGGERRPGLALQ